MRYLKFLLLMFFLVASKGFAIERIDITKGNTDPMPIAINDFVGSDSKAIEISSVIANDLKSSGLFRPIEKESFIEYIHGIAVQPNYAAWRQINATAVVAGQVSRVGGELQLEFKLYDVYGGQQIAGKSISGSETSWRKMAHIVADEIYSKLTGEAGYFDTKIVYISESGPGTKRIKRLAIMDQDGENHRFLTDGRNLVLTPRFSPDASKILYLSYVNNKPRVYVREIQSGRERVLGDFPGMTFAPRFSSDGIKAALSMAAGGVTDIYTLDMISLEKNQLTNDGSINTSPSFSPDGGRIAFNSDRAGKPQIYVMNADGSSQQRISFGDGRYLAPVWSPRGDLIAFTKISNGSFYIGVMKPDGSMERVITQGYLVEGQTWAANGRVIAYARGQRGNVSKINVIDITGYNDRELITPLDASDPSWSKLLH